MEDISYKIKCSNSTFQSLKADERFLSLLTLARVVNALRFCQKAATDAESSNGPSSARSRFNSALFASSVMYEGLHTASSLGKHFADLGSFKRGFGALLKDKKIRNFNQTVLKRMRNKFVFHFDQDVMEESFKEFELPEYVFALGKGKAAGEMYFGLADEAVFNYLLQPGENESNESLMNRYKEILQTTTELMRRFTEAADFLMADILEDMGFNLETNNKTEAHK